MTQDNDSAYKAEYDRHWNQAVKTMTAAARLEHPRYGTVDFADFLATALRATAANLGDPHTLTAGRPGSWESAAISELLHGAVGLNPTMFELAEYRTEPIVVPLNVDELVEVEDSLPDPPQPESGHDCEVRFYGDAYRAYADRFTAAVQSEAATHPGLADLVTTISECRLAPLGGSDVSNPVEGDSDPLVWHFWSTARENVGLPMIQGGP